MKLDVTAHAKGQNIFKQYTHNAANNFCNYINVQCAPSTPLTIKEEAKFKGPDDSHLIKQEISMSHVH